MKRKIATFLLCFVCLSIAMSVLADMIPIAHNPLQDNDPMKFLEKMGNWIFTIAITVAPIMILVGAYMFVTAAGNPVKVQNGKKVLLYTLIGFTIMMTSKGIIVVLKEILKK